MQTITFTANDTMVAQLDAIGRLQHLPREAVLADAIAAYIDQHHLDTLAPPDTDVATQEAEARAALQLPPGTVWERGVPLFPTRPNRMVVTSEMVKEMEYRAQQEEDEWKLNYPTRTS